MVQKQDCLLENNFQSYCVQSQIKSTKTIGIKKLTINDFCTIIICCTPPFRLAYTACSILHINMQVLDKINKLIPPYFLLMQKRGQLTRKQIDP